MSKIEITAKNATLDFGNNENPDTANVHIGFKAEDGWSSGLTIKVTLPPGLLQKDAVEAQTQALQGAADTLGALARAFRKSVS